MRRQNSPTWELDKEIKHFDIGTDSGTKVAARGPLGHIQRFKRRDRRKHARENKPIY